MCCAAWTDGGFIKFTCIHILQNGEIESAKFSVGVKVKFGLLALCGITIEPPEPKNVEIIGTVSNGEIGDIWQLGHGNMK